MYSKTTENSPIRQLWRNVLSRYLDRLVVFFLVVLANFIIIGLVIITNALYQFYSGNKYLFLGTIAATLLIGALKIGINRVMSIVIALLSLVSLFPLIVLLAILINLESPGPVFYRAQRVGRHGRIIQLYKFRTMLVKSSVRDHHLTKIGRILRQTKLDELPQLFNILLGDLDLFGPSPVPTWEASDYTIEEFKDRFMKKPGMIHLWNLDNVSNESSQEGQYDPPPAELEKIRDLSSLIFQN